MNSLLHNIIRTSLKSPVNNYIRQLSLSPVCQIKKHYLQKWRKLRGKKMFKIELPDYEVQRRIPNMTPDEVRSYMKEKGIVPTRPWNERPITVSCTNGILDPYIPPEHDGKLSVFSKEGSKQKFEWGKKKYDASKARRTLRVHEEEFDIPNFLDEAMKKYVDTHKALCTYDEDKLHELVTDHCYAELCHQTKLKTLRWELVENLEPPRVVNTGMTPDDQDEFFAQITVRFHSRQKLAVYDRFGRFIYGSETIPKDVLEFVVFEKQINNQYGSWKVHAKIIPTWAPPKDSVAITRAVKLEENTAEASP